MSRHNVKKQYNPEIVKATHADRAVVENMWR